MRFRVESCIVCAGIVLLLGAAANSGNFWEQVVLATNCSQGCGNDTHICAGTDVLLMCGGCSNKTTGRTWYDPITRGSTSGADAIAFASVNCNTVVPCNVATTYQRRRCVGTGDCITAIFTPDQPCIEYAAGTEVVNTVSTCHTTSCDEEDE